MVLKNLVQAMPQPSWANIFTTMGKVSEIFRSIESLVVEFLTRQPDVANLTYLMLPLLWHVLRAHVCRLHRKNVGL